MKHTLHYGTGKTAQLTVPDEAIVAVGGARDIDPIDDCMAAAAAAVIEPIDYPSIADAVMPGDHVAIALGPDIPCSAEIIAGVVHSLLSTTGKHCSTQIAVVCPAGCTETITAVAAIMPETFREQVTIVEHDPANRKELSYLAASFESKPIYLNRHICDADVVISLGVVRSPDSFANWGFYSSLFPTFADAEAINRFLFPKTDASTDSVDRRKKQAQEAAWQLGARFYVQVIPGAEDNVLAVLAGDCDSVAVQADRQFDRAWNAPITQKADLTIGAMSGHKQSWENLVRAIHTASQAVDEGGAIAICCDLNAPPTAAFQMLASGEDPETQLRRIQTERPQDGLFAVLLLETLERHAIYLLSGLDTNVVEALGMTAVRSPEELTRLCQQHESVVILENAQIVMPTTQSQARCP